MQKGASSHFSTMKIKYYLVHALTLTHTHIPIKQDVFVKVGKIQLFLYVGHQILHLFAFQKVKSFTFTHDLICERANLCKTGTTQEEK